MRAARRIVALVFFCTLVAPLAAQTADPLPRAKPEDVGMSSERLALIRKVIESEVARDQLPGGVLAIARRSRWWRWRRCSSTSRAAC